MRQSTFCLTLWSGKITSKSKFLKPFAFDDSPNARSVFDMPNTLDIPNGLVILVWLDCSTCSSPELSKTNPSRIDLSLEVVSNSLWLIRVDFNWSWLSRFISPFSNSNVLFMFISADSLTWGSKLCWTSDFWTPKVLYVPIVWLSTALFALLVFLRSVCVFFDLLEL